MDSSELEDYFTHESDLNDDTQSGLDITQNDQGLAQPQGNEEAEFEAWLRGEH